MYDFSGKTVMITGVGSGIGLSHAKMFAEAGASVILHDRDEARLRTITAALRDAGRSAIPFACDIRNTEAIEAGIADLVRSGGPIDALVNNAGIMGDAPLEEASVELFDDVFAVNVAGAFFVTKAVVTGMKTRRRGKIVLTSSTWGMVGHPGSSVYSGSKAALLGLTKAWAREFAPFNIHVNCIAPGGVTTDLLVSSSERIAAIPLKRHAEPIDISRTAAFLASPASDFMTGAVISPNGGEIIVGY